MTADRRQTTVVQRLTTGRATAAGVAVLTLLAAVLLWLAPNERTLGPGIKPVYLHVALTWTGLVGLLVAALFGLGTVLTARVEPDHWAHTIGWVALAFFGAGFALSLVASQVNWGGLSWAEPRNATALNTLAAGWIAQVVGGWPLPVRARGLLRVLPPALYGLSVSAAPLVLHPRNPIAASPSLAIQLTFFGLFALCLLAAAWMVLYWQGKAAAPVIATEPAATSAD